MKKMMIVPVCALLLMLAGCSSLPEGGNANSPAALLGVSMDGNASALPQDKAVEIARTVLSEDCGLIFSDAAEVGRVVQKATKKAQRKAKAKARSARFDNFMGFAFGSKSAIDIIADEIAIRSDSINGIDSINTNAEFAKTLHKALAKDSMTQCRSFVYVTVSAGVQEKDGFVKPCARTVIQLKDKSNRNIKSVMAVCGAQPVATADAVADKSSISASFAELTEQSLRLAAENLFTAEKTKERFTMETETLITAKPSMMLLSTWK